MAHFGTAGPLCLLWFADKLSVTFPISLGSWQNLVQSLKASQPEEKFDLGRFLRLAEDLSLASSTYHSSLAYRVGRLTLGYLQEEPDAGKPHVRICEGESRMAELLDLVVPYRIYANKCTEQAKSNQNLILGLSLMLSNFLNKMFKSWNIRIKRGRHLIQLFRSKNRHINKWHSPCYAMAKENRS